MPIHFPYRVVCDGCGAGLECVAELPSTRVHMSFGVLQCLDTLAFDITAPGFVLSETRWDSSTGNRLLCPACAKKPVVKKSKEAP